MSETALVLPFPAAEQVVGRWREQFDPSASLGVPAHLTVLYPWLDSEQLDDSVLGTLRELVSQVAACDLQLTAFGRFDRTLWLAPTPEDPTHRLTALVSGRWPEHQPYGGEFGSTPVAHLTVGHEIDPDSLGHVVADVSARLPVTGRVEHVALLVRDGERWAEHSTYPLG